MVYASYDTTNFPAVYVYISSDKPTNEVFDQQMKDFEKLLNMDKPFYILFDIRDAQRVSFSMLKREAEFIKRMKPKIVKNLIASSIVIDNILVQGLIKALFAIQAPSRPNKTFNNLEDAAAFLEEEHRKYVPGDITNGQEEDTDALKNLDSIQSYFEN